MTINPWVAGGMVGLSGLKYLDDKNAAPGKRAQQAELQRTSQWTGRQGQHVADPNLMDYLMSGAIGGIGLGSQVGDIGGLISDLNPEPRTKGAPANQYLTGKGSYDPTEEAEAPADISQKDFTGRSPWQGYDDPRPTDPMVAPLDPYRQKKEEYRLMLVDAGLINPYAPKNSSSPTKTMM